MEIIHAEFVPTSQTSLDYLMGQTGAYVLWSPRAVSRPSYIGEGNVLRRIVEHVQRFGSGLTGHAAVLSDGSEQQRKRNAELLEATLFVAAESLGIPPTHNKAPGKFARLVEKAKNHGVIRFRLSGYHPLRLNSRISGEHVVEWRYEGRGEDGFWDLSHPWRRS
jgi:hypothetical protein